MNLIRHFFSCCLYAHNVEKTGLKIKELSPLSMSSCLIDADEHAEAKLFTQQMARASRCFLRTATGRPVCLFIMYQLCPASINHLHHSAFWLRCRSIPTVWPTCRETMKLLIQVTFTGALLYWIWDEWVGTFSLQGENTQLVSSGHKSWLKMSQKSSLETRHQTALCLLKFSNS